MNKVYCSKKILNEEMSVYCGVVADGMENLEVLCRETAEELLETVNSSSLLHFEYARAGIFLLRGNCGVLLFIIVPHTPELPAGICRN